MKKLVLLMAFGLQLMSYGQTTIFSENFSSITTGNNNTTGGSGTAWTGNTNFPSTGNSAVYQAGNAVKIGTSSAVGFITTKTLDLSQGGGNFTLVFNVKGWSTVEGNITVTITNLANQTVTYTATLTSAFETKTLNLTGGTSNSTIKIATTAKRAFIDSVVVTVPASTLPCSTSPNLTSYQATNSCPNWQVQLDSVFIPTNKPATSKISWHTGDTAKLSNKMGNFLNVDPGTYYISYYDSANNCYSATKAVTVTQTNCNQICFYNENFGTPTVNTGVDTFLGFQNGAPISYKGNVDVRTTSASNGYSGASGSGNVFLTSTSLPRKLVVSGINSLNYKNLQLSFGIMKATSDSFKLNIEVGLDTINMTSLSYSTVLGQSQWAYITPTGNIPKTTNLYIRFSNSNTSQFRLDDLKLCGEPICNIIPNLNDTMATNTCPDTVINLGVKFIAQNKPANLKLTWHTMVSANPNNKMTNLVVSGPAVYYASYYDSANNCYSATRKVYVTKTNCGCPQIIIQPTASAFGCNGSNFNSLSVVASNATSYQWKQGGTNKGGTSATISINPFTVSDTGNYTVVVSGTAPCADVTSTIANVNITDTAKIVTQPASLTDVCVGGTLRLKVVGNGAASYQWYKGTTAISGETKDSLVIANVAAATAGTYKVEAIAFAGCVNTTSSNAVVTISTPVTFTTQPAASTICAGGTINLSTAVSGNSSPTYVWKKDGVALGAPSSTSYSKLSAMLSDSGNYTVEVTGSASCPTIVSNVAKVTINAAPTITAISGTSPLCVGSTLTLSATATNNNGVIWKKGTATVGTSSSYSKTAATSDAGSYTVTAVGKTGCADVTSAAFTQAITSPASITTQPVSTAVLTGSSFTLSVTASNANTYQWYKGTTAIAGETNSSYTVSSFDSATDAGSYTVEITSNSPCTGTITSTVATVTKTTCLVITSNPLGDTLCAGSSLTLNVTAVGANGYKWYRNNIVIPGATTSTYNVSNATSANSGTYRVEAIPFTGTTCGQIVSPDVNVLVESTPMITAQPRGNANCAPTAHTLRVTTSTTGHSYQWFKNGVAVSGATLDSLNVTTFTPTGDKYFVSMSGTGVCPSVSSDTVTVIPKSTVTIVKQYNGIPAAITLTANQNPMDSFSTYKWTFKGNLIPNAISKTYYKSFTTANDTGNYCAIVTGWSGCKDTACIMAKDTFSCNIDANYRVASNANKIVTLVDSSFFTPNISKTIKVYWGDGQSNTYTSVGNMVHTYSKDTFYNVCYVVKYLQFNCSDSICKMIKVNASSATISCTQYKTFTKTINGTTVVLEANSVPAPYKVSYNWVLSNGVTKNSRIFDTVLPSGSYWAKLYICITDDSNNILICCDSSVQTFNILNCNLSGSVSKNGNALTANPIGGTSPFTYIWSNGMITKTIMNIVPGQYCVTIYDANQCSSVNCYTVTNPNPNVPCTLDAKFGFSYTSSGAIQFNDSSTSNGLGMSYIWSFGDGTYSTQKNPLKSYGQNGTYTVTLVVTSWINTSNQYCIDTFTSTVNIVNVNPCNAFVPNFTWTQSGTTYSFVNTSALSGYTVLSTQWQFSDGTTTTLSNPIKTFTTSGTKVIVLTMTVRNNQTQTTCTKTVTKYLNVNTSPCASHKAYNTFTKAGKTVTFTNTSIGTNSTTTYLYKFGNGDTSNLPSPSYTYALPGLYRTVMYVKTTFNNVTCIDSFVRIVQITTSNLCKDSGYTTYYNYPCQNYTSPVCGCDSVTYQNYCMASRAGVKQYSYGPCANDTSYVTICGYVVNDMNRNCQKDATDLAIPSVKITINTVPPTNVYSNASGYYTTVVKKGTYTLTQSLNSNTNPFAYKQLCPAAGISVAATSAGQVYCNNNFYDTTNICQDLSTSIQRVANITPGFTSMKRIKYQNNGATAVANAVLHYRFLNALAIKTTTSSPYSVSGNIISWNIGTIPPYTSGFRNANFQTPTNLPLGTTVIDSAWIEPMTGDCNLANNSAIYRDTCVGSYDPNDKTAFPAGNTDTSVKVIDYLVRFQNTGTAPAHNVVIVDSLENNLDFNTLTLHSTSHKPCRVFTNDNKKVYFEFENIMLPDSGTDYEGSQGYVNFSIKLKDNLAVGTQIKNTAAIYFDFNDPIITNTTVNTIYLKSSSGIISKEKDYTLELYPNPTKGEKVTLKVTSDKMQTVSYRIFDLNGREKMTTIERKANGHFEEEIQLNSFSKGIYLIDISINGEASGKIKLVKD